MRRFTSDTRFLLAASIKAIVNSAVAAPDPSPSPMAIPAALQAAKSICEFALPTCEISLRLGSLSINSFVIRVRSRIRTKASADARAATLSSNVLRGSLRMITSWSFNSEKHLR